MVLPLDSGAAEESAKIMGSLLRVGRPVKVLDAMIAGSAFSNAANVLLTKDKEFEEIEKVSRLDIQVL